MRERGLIARVVTLPDGVVMEGAGDCLFDEARNLFWMGFGQRSERRAVDAVAQTFGLAVVPLQLVDPRFYHLDTAFCPLPSGDVIYHAGAFTDEAASTIASACAGEQAHRAERGGGRAVLGERRLRRPHDRHVALHG